MSMDVERGGSQPFEVRPAGHRRRDIVKAIGTVVIGLGYALTVLVFLFNMCPREDGFEIAVRSERAFTDECLKQAIDTHYPQSVAPKQQPRSYLVPTGISPKQVPEEPVMLWVYVEKTGLRVSASWTELSDRDVQLEASLTEATDLLVERASAACGVSSWHSACQRQSENGPCPEPASK